VLYAWRVWGGPPPPTPRGDVARYPSGNNRG
jgi:hypothetical protein